MDTLAKKMERTERLERRVDDLLQVESNTRTVWAHWMGKEMTTIHEDLLDYLKESFQLLKRYQ